MFCVSTVEAESKAAPRADEAKLFVSVLVDGDGFVDDERISRSFWRRRLRRLHLRDALARCHALLGLIDGGYVSKASSLI